MNWGIKSCFKRTKFDHSTDLKIRHKILPVRHFLDYKCLLYLWKYKNSLFPAFNRKLHLPTAATKTHKRTQIEYSDMTIRSIFLRNCFFKRALPLWNTLPRKMIEKIRNSEKKNKIFSLSKIRKWNRPTTTRNKMLECLPFYIIHPHNHPFLLFNWFFINYVVYTASWNRNAFFILF